MGLKVDPASIHRHHKVLNFNETLRMKCLKSSWLGTGVVVLLLANSAMAQNNDDERKGRGKDRGQNARQSDQYPQSRRQAVSPGESQQRSRSSRPQVDSQPVEKGQRDGRTRDNDTQPNERNGRNMSKDNNQKDDLQERKFKSPPRPRYASKRYAPEKSRYPPKRHTESAKRRGREGQVWKAIANS